jgi:hypothetical protein
MDEISGRTATLLHSMQRRHLRMVTRSGPRRFQLFRREDVSGVVWSDGTVALRWGGCFPTTTVWQDGIDALITVHGHNGRTIIRWLDE